MAHLSNTITVTGASSTRKREVRALEVDPNAPSPDNIPSGHHPFYRPLHLPLPRNPTSKGEALVGLTLSDEGQRIIGEQGTVNPEKGQNLSNPWGGLRAPQGK